MTIEEITDQIFALFPVGSKWYDCRQDDVAVVQAHFRPRGLLLKSVTMNPPLPDLTTVGFTDLLNGRLVPYETAVVENAFHGYAKAQKEADVDFQKLVGDRPVWS